MGDAGPGSAAGPAEDGLLSRMALNDNKAGMEGLDREKINKIILEASKGSRFYENELKKERQVNQRVEKMLQQKGRVAEEHLRTAQVQVDKMISELERSRELSRVIVHVDMDAFYAAVEMRDRPELKDQPMAVGSMSMLSTSNYHARRFGVRAAMPGFIAKKLCPNLVIVPLNFDKYKAVSSQVREVFSDYDQNFLPMSLDEAYLDITAHLEMRRNWPECQRSYRVCAETLASSDEGGSAELPEAGEKEESLSPVLFDESPGTTSSFQDPPGRVEVFGTTAEEAVREMRFRIEHKTSLTASAGIAPNMMLAKVCSDKNKPNGQYRIPPERREVMDFILDLPVRKVPGIGKVTEKMLAALGINCCSQLGQKMALLSLLFSETSWHHFLQISLGLGSTHIVRNSERKSMSTERTFGEMSVAEEQLTLCKELCEDLAQELLKEGLKGKTVTLKVKNVKFEVKTRALTLPYSVSSANEIYTSARDLLRAELDHVSPEPLRLRLMGVRVSGFASVDEKRPQQRSIMGFLQSGGSDVIKASETTPPIPLSTSCPQPEQKAIPRTFSSSGPQQMSFFQRIQAERLQQAELAGGGAKDLCEIQAGFVSRPFTPPPIHTPPTISSSSATLKTHTVTSTSLHTDSVLTHSPPCTSAPVSLMPHPLTCPVCFKDMETSDLTAFNMHIDECLKCSAAQKGDEGSLSGSRVLETVTAGELQPAGEKDKPGDVSVTSGVCGHTPLVCPVCGQMQETADLTTFNHHVDECLNHNVLLELRETGIQTVHEGKSQREGGSGGKKKRQGSSPPPPSKKAKAAAPKNTIDRFFR
ncbi:DNA polymerase kappa isoform X2 [Denticeps clupeoides]|uniref:DNA polymerase kappa isoform X2 n=1 Tax=Denticeps clupeoides TaxID=299321 RepID=UPI0010A3E236|nr:DNA polymerase kappa isoform X2 [Denticeps clupeoides]